jgi:hypothetical protein
MAESGHIKNVENLRRARDFGSGWGGSYQPSNAMLDIGAMTALLAGADGVIDGVQSATTPYRNATAACEDAFDLMSPLTTRVMKAAKSMGIADSVMEDAQTFSRKIKGQRKTPAKKDDPSTPDIDESKESHSASQMSRTQRIEHFDNLRFLFEAQPDYKPNEVDLKTDSLKTYSDGLKDKMTTINSTFVPYSNSLASRDDILYINNENVVKTGRLFKTYVEGAFGRSSTEWQQVKGLEFKDMRRK